MKIDISNTTSIRSYIYKPDEHTISNVKVAESLEVKDYVTLLENILTICYHKKNVWFRVYVMEKNCVPDISLENIKEFTQLRGSLKFNKFVKLLNETYKPLCLGVPLIRLGFRTPPFNSELEKVNYLITARKNVNEFASRYEQ